MCTLSWGLLPDGYFVAFSRDERRTRAAGLAPRAIEQNGVRALMPIDAEAGGTWIVVNELGCTLALLNGYRFQDANAPVAADTAAWISRGKLVMDLCDVATDGAVAERISALKLSRFRPFELAVMDGEGRASLHTWNGAAIERRALTLQDRPLVSSSFDDSGAREQRRALFARSVGAGAAEQDVLRFHSSHEPARGAYSPCMHREDAQTVSFTHVRVSARDIELSYQPDAPCLAGSASRQRLRRRSVARS